MPKAKDGKPKLMSIRRYAKHRKDRGYRGQSDTAVSKALKTGRISRTCDKHGRCPPSCGRGKINPVLADADWDANTGTQGSGQVAAMGKGYSRSKGESEQLKVIKLRMEIDEKAGKLGSIATMRAEIYRIFRDLRNRMLAISPRIASRVGAKDQRKAEIVVRSEMNEVFEDTAENLEEESNASGPNS